MRSTQSKKRSHKRTPCVGICSTTYGDLVCRGCKRFAHEIVSWNAYTPTQRERIETRLRELKVGALQDLLQIADRSLGLQVLRERDSQSADAVFAESELLWCLFELWLRQPSAGPHNYGLALRSGVADLQDLNRRLDAECYARARAYYERSFKVTTA